MGSDRHIIVNADDYGLSLSFNKGIEKAYQHGLLTSTSVRVNGKAYSESIMQRLKRLYPGLGVGLHLNIVEGQSPLSNPNAYPNIYNQNEHFSLSYIKIIKNSLNPEFLHQVEREFRDQIETIQRDYGYIDHIDSHQHCNTPPAIFELTCKLAQEYSIPFIRIPNDNLVFSKKIEKIFTLRFIVNTLKVLILKFFAIFNRRSAKKHGIRINDRFVGVLYTGFMDATVIKKALLASRPSETMEILLHPCEITGSRDENFWPEVRDYVINHNRRRELEALLDKSLIYEVEKSRVQLTSYGELVTEFKASIQKQIPTTQQGELESKLSPLRVFLVIDETTFFHPEFVEALINELPTIDCVGCCRVVLPRGGALQKYLVTNWRNLGLRDFLLLGSTTIFLKLRGALPKKLRNNFNSSVLATLEQNGIPHITISTIDRHTMNHISSFEPDLIISSNSLIFPKELIEIPKLGVINRHSSLLPSYGGILPVFRAIQFDETFCGASVHLMDEKIDTGPVLSRKWLPIEKEDTVFNLYKLLFVLSFQATKEAIEKLLEHGVIDSYVNDEDLQQSYFSYPKPEDWIEFKKRGGRFM